VCTPRKTLEITKEKLTTIMRISLRKYKIEDLVTLMILADEHEELEKEREVFSQE